MPRSTLYVLLIIISLLTALVSAYVLGDKISQYFTENGYWSINIDVAIPQKYKLDLSNTTIEKLSKYTTFSTIIPVFVGNGPYASVGFGMSAGYYKPGDKIGVTLDIYRPQYYIPGLKFSVKLFRIYGHILVLINHVDSGEASNIKFDLPQVQGAKYLLVVEAIMNNTVVDMIRSYIIVPIQYMDAAIYTDKQIYRPGEKLTYAVINLGSDPIIFGPYYYKIYKYIGGSWIIDNELTPRFIPDIAMIVYAVQSRGFTISLNNASPGLYKIVIEVEGVSTGKRLNLETTFIITEK